VTPIDPGTVRKLVEEAVDRVLAPPSPSAAPAATTAKAAPSAAAAPPAAKAAPAVGSGPARVHDWTRSGLGDVRPVREPAVRPPGKKPGEPALPDPARTVSFGGDHGGFALKESLRRYLVEELRYAVIDCGAYTAEPVDYPDIARAVGFAVAEGRAFRGVVVDTAGIGSTMAANRVPGVRCALCHDVATVVNAREHNDGNVLALGSKVVSLGQARQMLATFLKTPFAGGRHARRVAKIMDLERLRPAVAGEKP